MASTLPCKEWKPPSGKRNLGLAFKVPKFLIIWKLVNAFSALPKKKPAFGQLSRSKCQRLLSSSGKEREAAETQTAGRFQKPQCGAGSSGRGLVPGSEKSISISPFQMKLMQFNQSDETVKLLIILCIFHASVTGRLEIWGDSSVYFSKKKKKKMKENC